MQKSFMIGITLAVTLACDDAPPVPSLVTPGNCNQQNTATNSNSNDFKLNNTTQSSAQNNNANNSPSNTTADNCTTSFRAGDAKNTGVTPQKSDYIDPEIPNPGTEQLYDQFGRNKIDPAQIPTDEIGKSFQVIRVPFYRSVWINSQKSTWVANSKAQFWSKIGLSKPSTSGGPLKLSIHQPLPILDPNAAKTGGFVIVGHALHQAIQLPPFPTMTLSRLAHAEFDVYKEPVRYKKIYDEKFPIDQQYLQEECTQEAFAKPATATQCFAFLSQQIGSNPVALDGTYKIGTALLWSDLFNKMSVAIWEAKCQEGYVPLGVVASNAELSQPLYQEAVNLQNTLIDGKNSNFASGAITSKKASYCVKEEFTTKGQLIRLFSRQLGKKSLRLYRIGAKDPKEGYGDGNLFHAIYAENPDAIEQETSVYVLKRKFLKILPDETLGPLIKELEPLYQLNP